MSRVTGFAHHVVAGMLALGMAACATPPQGSEGKALDEPTAAELAAFGESRLGIRWQQRPQGGEARGLRAVTDGITTLTTRAPARVYIVHDRKRFPPEESAMFKGSDEQLKSIGVQLLQTVGARSDEIGELRVLQQFTQVGETSPEHKAVLVQPPQASHRALLATRRVQGIEVPSSRLLLHVDAAGQPAYLELAWPDLDPALVERAHVLRRHADNRALAPRVDGASVESMQAVILHSPAFAQHDDSVTAIRVIYRSNDERTGKKAVRYIDADGRDVGLPRDIDRPREKPAQRSAPRS